jgi:hypothetical protein
VSVVQCKHWQNKPVGVKELREFFGVMASHSLKRGTCATTSTYTADAMGFAKANGISAMDGPALPGLIATRTPEQQANLLSIACEGEFWKPTCASCGLKQVERTPAKGGRCHFLGLLQLPPLHVTYLQDLAGTAESEYVGSDAYCLSTSGVGSCVLPLIHLQGKRQDKTRPRKHAGQAEAMA